MTLDDLEKTFDQMRSGLLVDHEAEWVLMRSIDTTPVFFDSEQDAVTAGFQTSDDQRFLVKQVLADDPVLAFSLAF